MKRSVIACAIVSLGIMPVGAIASPFIYDYVKEPSYDINEPAFGLATAANMPAAAGYGNPADIYSVLKGNFGMSQLVWQHTALAWYVGHHHRENFYKVIKHYTSHLNPAFMIQELQRCNYVGFAARRICQGTSHFFTAWGYAIAPDFKIVITEPELTVGLQHFQLLHDVDTGRWFFLFQDRFY